MRCCAVTALDALSNQYKQDGALADPVNFVATHMLKREGADLEPPSSAEPAKRSKIEPADGADAPQQVVAEE